MDVTRDTTSKDGRTESSDGAEPGLLVVFAGERARLAILPLGKEVTTFGRTTLPAGLVDEKMSREHLAVRRTGPSTVELSDAGSRNGTFLNGERLRGSVRIAIDDVRGLRCGSTVLVGVANVRPYVGMSTLVTPDGLVLGASLRSVVGRAERAAAHGSTLLVMGDTGSGKELVARAFHERGPRASGPFVAVNCATVPASVAERVLFGAVKGAYSGADAAAKGYAQAAQRGTLFLDEMGELPLEVQAKILRMLESSEVTPLGATRAEQVDISPCFATHRDLRAAAAEGSFREDLYYRIAQPSVAIPPLARRLEEVPFLLEKAVSSTSPALVPHVTLVETCLLRDWPGNVRELLRAVKDASLTAIEAGDAAVRAEHLAESAGRRLDAPSRAVTPDEITLALKEAGGNVSKAARSLGLHRTQFYRLMERHGLRPGPSDPES